MEIKHSGMGIASFIISLVIGCGSFFLLLIAGVMKAANPENLPEDSSVAAVLGLFIIGCLFVHLIGVGLGIAGLAQKERKRLFSILGIVCNGIVFIGVLALILVGIMMP